MDQADVLYMVVRNLWKGDAEPYEVGFMAHGAYASWAHCFIRKFPEDERCQGLEASIDGVLGDYHAHCGELRHGAAPQAESRQLCFSMSHLFDVYGRLTGAQQSCVEESHGYFVKNIDNLQPNFIDNGYWKTNLLRAKFKRYVMFEEE